MKDFVEARRQGEETSNHSQTQCSFFFCVYIQECTCTGNCVQVSCVLALEEPTEVSPRIIFFKKKFPICIATKIDASHTMESML